jgi:hypothetical protein
MIVFSRSLAACDCVVYQCAVVASRAIALLVNEKHCLACSECCSAGRARWGLEPVNESAYASGRKPTSSEVPRSTCRPSRAARRKCQTRCTVSRVESARFEETGLELAVVHYFGWLAFVCVCA